MATNKKETSDVVETPTDEKVLVDRKQLDAILAGYEDMKQQVAQLTEQSMSNANTVETRKLAEEKRLLGIVEKANEEAEKLVPYYVDLGSLRSNKNLEVSNNGVQTIVPRGEDLMLKKSVVEVIENSKEQQAISLGIQEKRSKEYEKAKAEGGVD